MWMGEGYGIRIGIIALGLILAFIGYMYVDKKEDTPGVVEEKASTPQNMDENESSEKE